jgi:hypothetical protein
MAKKKSTRLFLLSWDNTGLETVLDLTTLDQLRQEEDKERMLAILSSRNLEDPGNKTMTAINSAVSRIIMRARANTQRHYEIYTVQAEGYITEKELWDMFESDPQGSADLIRMRGNKVYSDRAKKPLIV